MIYANVGRIRDPLKQDLVLELCTKQNRNNSILTETHINHDKIHQIVNNWLGHIFLSPRNIHTKGLLGQLHPGLEGVTEVDTDPKGRFVSFKITLSNDRVLYVCSPSGHNTREQLIKDVSLKDYKMENKYEGNENRIPLGDFNIIMDIMDRDGGNKTQRLYWYRSKGPGYTGSTLI